MQEYRYDGTDELTPNASIKDLERALANEKNKAVTLHKTGSIITRSDGSQYEVWTDGSLRKIKEAVRP